MSETEHSTEDQLPPDATQTPDAAAEDVVAEDDPEARIAALEAEVSDLKDKLLRAAAEVENTRRRARLDREEAAQYGIAGFARDLLEVADNLRRALEHVDQTALAEDEALKSLYDGVAMTEKVLVKAFEKHGIGPVAPLGEKLDPNLHQAVFEMPHADYDNGHVGQVMQLGYVLNGRLLRPAMVGVVKNPPKPDGATEDDAPGTTLDTQA